MASNDLPEFMDAIQVVEFGTPYVLNRVKVPKTLKPYEILLKTAVASYCHTDQMVRDGVFKTQLPVTASHEGAGTVVLCGSLVNTFTIGDRVMAHVKRNTCGRCDACLGPDKWKYYCRGPRDSLGITGDGAFAEYLVCDSRWSVKLPESVSFLTAAPCACAGATAFRAVKMTGLTKGQSIAIIGSGGGVGHLAVRFARHRDLRVIAIDARDEGLDASTKAGAEIVFDARSGSDAIADQVMVLTNGDGCDATINFAESSQASALACRVTKTHGTMWQVAQPSIVMIPYQELVLRDVRVQGTVICSPDDAKEMVAVLPSMGPGIVQTTLFHGLESISSLVELVSTGGISGKAIVIIDGSQL